MEVKGDVANLAARMTGQAQILPGVFKARERLEDIARERLEDTYRCSKTHCETKPPPDRPPATLQRPMSPLMQCESKAPGVEPPEKKLRTCSDSPPANTPGLSPIREKTFQGVVTGPEPRNSAVGRQRFRPHFYRPKFSGVLCKSYVFFDKVMCGVPLLFSSTFRLV